MSSILGTSLAQKLLQSGKQYLTRGHLVAKADFVYVEQQRSTFWYVNTAPQWKSFNQGNWQKLENSVRRFVKNRHLDLDVYTGTDDIMTIEDAQGNQRPIFLVDPVVANSKIYVPRFFWKIIYDPLSKRGTAFVGVNDPFIKSLTKDVVLCDDISDKITWLDWTPNEIELGLSYACSIDNLRESWMWLPPLDVDGILMWSKRFRFRARIRSLRARCTMQINSICNCNKSSVVVSDFSILYICMWERCMLKNNKRKKKWKTCR